MRGAHDALSSLGLVEIERSIFAVGASPSAGAHYDRMGRLYDLACGTRLYGRVVWGTSPEDSRDFAQRVFDARREGPHLEVGCGGLLFTAPLYDEDRGRPCVLTDPSIAMLRMARARLERRHRRVPAHVLLLRANGLDLPLPAGFATTVLSLHVLHVLRPRAAFLGALRRAASPARGVVGLSSLVRTGTWRDAGLTALHWAGELAPLLDADGLRALVDGAFAPAQDQRAPTIDVEVRAAMAFAVASFGPPG